MIERPNRWREHSDRLKDGLLTIPRERILDDLDTLAPMYADLNTAAFALDQPTTIDEAADRLTKTDLLLLALDDSHEPVGFATYQFIPSAAGRVIYQARGLTKEARGRSYGKKFPQAAARELRADFLIAKAQNPISIWSTMSAGVFETAYPLHGDFTESPEMSRVLLDTVAARGKTGEVDLRTGVHKGSYPMGKLGDYDPDFSHPGVAAVQARLLELGIDATNGDAIYYGGKIV